MVPVYPYNIRRSATGEGGELLLSLKDRKTAMVLQLTMDQARMLAVEMRGLATDNCSLHHMLLAVTRPLGAEISGVLIKGVGDGQVTGCLRMEHQDRVLDVNVDVGAALAVAMHLGLPIFMDSFPALQESQVQPMDPPERLHQDVPIPEAFRDVIEALVLPSPNDDEDSNEGGIL